MQAGKALLLAEHDLSRSQENIPRPYDQEPLINKSIKSNNVINQALMKQREKDKNKTGSQNIKLGGTETDNTGSGQQTEEKESGN